MSCPWKQLSERRMPPLPGNSSHHIFSRRSGSPDIYLNPNDVKTYLSAKPWILKEFVLKHYHLEEIQEWFAHSEHNHPDHSKTKKCQPNFEKDDGQHSGGYGDTVQSENLLTTIVKGLEEHHGIPDVLMPTMECLARTVQTDEYFLFMVGVENHDLQLCVEANGRWKLSAFGPCKPKTTIAAFAATSKKGILTSDILGDERFPLGVGTNDSKAKSVMCVPVLQPNGEVRAVLELIRHYTSEPFTLKDYQLVSRCLLWIGIAIDKTQACMGLTKQREFNNFLLEVSRVIFDDIVAIDTLTEHIMTFAKDLVQADRCTLFLLDGQTEELYADLFDEGLTKDGRPIYSKKKQIRFPIEKGIAGHVARTGEVVNIPNAYNDPRFNREVDVATGYTTRNILCMPIVSRGKVIGVVQMINKNGPPHIFDQNDESNFRMFAIYCALALHYSKIYSSIQQSERILAVTQEQLHYHSTSTLAEANRVVARWCKQNFVIPANFDRHEFDCKQFERFLPELFIQMVHDLFGPDTFDLTVLARFFLTIRKNYRPIPFHNIYHAFQVAHCMYYIISHTPGLLTNVEMQAAFFASICHDVDHQARTNAFLRKHTSRLGSLYPTGSLMEQHHFNYAMNIIQSEGHNIFAHLPLNIYKQVVSVFKHVILSTDLALSFGNCAEIQDMVSAGTFDIENHLHRSKLLSLIMTVCDLCAVSKLWPTQRSSVEAIYSEFYEEGDLEKKLGGQPLPLFDRDNKENQAKEQVFFISKIAMPNFDILSKIIPCVEPMLEATKDNLAQWEREGAGQSTSMWAVANSRIDSPSDETQE
ncbi:cAMP and cAMP-inhibited cGMP 3',5'-cyclic phosphodiesterase 10A-like isoform X1 [Apostichopus japonicus]|uniref:cAMP and cAMP-inhibited cGMP 3',5'-cyclic phosphodiesterase 10A-like isoform X1 n=1 Tax=Stichopus japonicus TaxID=307972 RepID=UPI003AB4924B